MELAAPIASPGRDCSNGTPHGRFPFFVRRQNEIFLLSTLKAERKGHLQESFLRLNNFRQVGVRSPALRLVDLPSLEQDAADGDAARDR